MLPTEDLFVYVYVLVHDLMAAGYIKVPPRPWPAGPAAMRNCWRSTRSGACSAGAARRRFGRGGPGPGRLFPLPHQSEADRRTRWLLGAFSNCRSPSRHGCPKTTCPQADTSALPVDPPFRVRGSDGWTGPGNDLAARRALDTADSQAWRKAAGPSLVP